MTITYKGMTFHAASRDNWPNVVRLEIPSNHRNDGAAWVYVPHNNTIYIGPPGSYGDGGSVDLAGTIKSLTDIQQGEKLIQGVLYDDGFVDYFQPTDDDQEGALMGALQDYHDAYYDSNGAFRGKSQEHVPHNEYTNYPVEDDTAFDPEDDHGDDARPTLSADDLPEEWKWLSERDWESKKDHTKMMDTRGVKPIAQWSAQDHHDWVAKANEKRNRDIGYSSWGATREDYNHFRWSYGNDALVKGAPHQGLWLWPTESGYPDHFSQTGSEGLGNAAQGRVYPHLDGTWEILTWPERPRYVHDPRIKDAIQKQAEAAVRQYLVEKMDIDPSKIFYTKMGYGDAVSNYHSESYPGYSYKQKKQWNDGGDYDWDSERSVYDSYGGSKEQTSLKYDSEGNASYKTVYDPKTQQMSLVNEQPSFFNDRPGIMEKVIDKIKNNLKNQTPEDRWSEAVRQHEQNLTDQWREEDDDDTPPGTSTIQNGPNAKYKVHKSDGKVTVVSQQDYELAVEEYGPEHWYLAFLTPNEKAEQIEKMAAEMITDPQEEFTQKFLEDLKNGKQPTGQSYYDSGGSVKQEAFLWLGIGYGEDTGEGDPKDAEFLTGTAHWNIVNKLLGSKFPNISDFLDQLEQDNFKIPMVWGYSTRHPMLSGVIITFLTHLGGAKQDLEYYPQALAAAAHHYNMPVLDYDILDSDTPIMEHHPVSKVPGGGDGGTPPSTTAPTPSGAEHAVITPQDILPHKDRVVMEDMVGFVHVQTYYLGKDTLYETVVHGGDLDGHVFPSYSFDQAKDMHNSIVENETSYQQHSSSAIISKRKKKVKYHGLHHPKVLQHVYRYHDWFESCVPHPDDHDGDDNDTPSDPVATSSELAVS